MTEQTSPSGRVPQHNNVTISRELLRQVLDALQAHSHPRFLPDDSAESIAALQAALDSRRADIYRRISEVFDELGDEFLPAELYAKTGIRNVFANRILVASVLGDSFNCTIVGDFTPRRRWRKANK